MDHVNTSGLVIKGIGGFYTVRFADGQERVCRLRGKLRLSRDTVFVGDIVDVFDDTQDNGAYVITGVHPRKNHFIRPPVSNVDQLAIVFTAAVPKADLSLVDKLTFLCEDQGIEPMLIINKNDISREENLNQIIDDYKPTGYRMILTSTYTGEGLDKLKEALRGKVTCFSGQSGTGKSSLLNALIPELSLQVGAVSEKTLRGRHTTRETMLYTIDGDASVVDSPGFSLLDNISFTPGGLCRLYPEMRPVLDECRFTGCMHMSEPDCAVKALLNEKKLSPGRYERYKRMLEELIEKDKHKYD